MPSLYLHATVMGLTIDQAMRAFQNISHEVQHAPVALPLIPPGSICETCFDAPATRLGPAPWGGEMELCAPCAGNGRLSVFGPRYEPLVVTGPARPVSPAFRAIMAEIFQERGGAPDDAA